MLDFRRVNHQLTDDQSRRILSELKQSWDDSGKKDAGEMMKRVLEVFRVAGQRCFQEDQERSDSKEDEYNKKIQVSFCLNEKVVVKRKFDCSFKSFKSSASMLNT